MCHRLCDHSIAGGVGAGIDLNQEALLDPDQWLQRHRPLRCEVEDRYDSDTSDSRMENHAGTMLPDLQIRVEAVIAEGDMVVNRYTATATDTVGYMGMPPTGKVIRTPAIQVFRFANGKIVESWAARDDLGTLRQLGHLAAPGGSQQQKRDERREQP
jgi:predicted ester cyclase